MVGCSFWAYPVNSLIGYAIMLIGLPLYFYWRRQGALEDTMTRACRRRAQSRLRLSPNFLPKLHTAGQHMAWPAARGVADCTMADLDPRPEDFVLHGRNSYGYGPLIACIASRFAIPEACVVEGAGASFANHLAMAAILSPGDEVLIEAPAYELLFAALGYFQAEIHSVARRP